MTEKHATKERAGRPVLLCQLGLKRPASSAEKSHLFPATSALVRNLTTAAYDLLKSQDGQLKASGDSFSGLEQMPAFHFTAQATPTNDLLIQTHTLKCTYASCLSCMGSVIGTQSSQRNSIQAPYVLYSFLVATS